MSDMSTGPVQGESFALYAQVTRHQKTDSRNWSHRWQWIVSPKQAEDAADGSPRFYYLHRYQSGPTNRSKWRLSRTTYARLYANFESVLESESNPDVHMRTLWPTLVCGLLPHDVQAVAVDGKPWPVLDKLKRVSVSRGGFVI